MSSMSSMILVYTVAYLFTYILAHLHHETSGGQILLEKCISLQSEAKVTHTRGEKVKCVFSTS